jgi:hypothetical protein
MEVSTTPTPSFDMTDRLSVRSDRSSRSPQAIHGRRKRSQTLESEKIRKDGNQRLGVETSHLTATFTPSSLPSSAVSKPDSEIFSEMTGGTTVRTPEVTNFSVSVELDVHDSPSGVGAVVSEEEPQSTLLNTSDTTKPLIPGIVVTEDTDQSQTLPYTGAASGYDSDPQPFGSDDRNEGVPESQQAPQLPEPTTPKIVMKLSKRRRFKDWVNQVLDKCLPEADSRTPGRPGTQRRSSLFR